MEKNKLIRPLKIIETHLSWVLLTKDFAYKIKKPVKFPFLDFTTLKKRKFYTEEEFRLNKKISPKLYLKLIPLPDGEHAIKMVKFKQQDLLSNFSAKKGLNSSVIEQLSNLIASFHQNALPSKPRDRFGSIKLIHATTNENFSSLRKLNLKHSKILSRIKKLEQWSNKFLKKNVQTFKQRKKLGFIRECHGDLHLGNIVLIEKKPILFDCIEFEPNLRMIDVMDDIAFLSMDLKFKKNFEQAAQLINLYLRQTGDYAGLKVLKFYEVYRALVRAKVALLNKNVHSRILFNQYLKLAETLIRTKKPTLTITHGVSGSGKTIFATQFSKKTGAIHLQSDIERKRNFGHLSKKALYSPAINGKVYLKLLNLTEMILKSGYSVIVDATFLDKKNRVLFKEKAKALKVKFIMVSFKTDISLLKQRVRRRSLRKKSESDADLSVLKKQLNRTFLYRRF